MATSPRDLEARLRMVPFGPVSVSTTVVLLPQEAAVRVRYDKAAAEATHAERALSTCSLVPIALAQKNSLGSWPGPASISEKCFASATQPDATTMRLADDPKLAEVSPRSMIRKLILEM